MDQRSSTWTLLKSWVVCVITFQPMDEIAIEPYFPLLTFLVQFLPRLSIKFVENVLFWCSNSHRFTSRHREAFVSQQTLTGFTAQVIKRLLLNDRDDLFLFLFSSFSCISQEFDLSMFTVICWSSKCCFTVCHVQANQNIERSTCWSAPYDVQQTEWDPHTIKSLTKSSLSAQE